MASEIKVDTIVNAGGDNDTGIDLATNDNIKFNIAGSQKAIIDSSGNVGIGESSPSNLLHVKVSDVGVAPHGSAQIVLERSGTNYLQLLTANNGTSGILFGDGDDADVAQIKYDHSSPSMQFVTETAERMRIDSSGNALVGTSSTTPNPGISLQPSGNIGIGNSSGNSGNSFLEFRRSASQIGGVTQSGTTGVNFNTSSDYRLKENVVTDWDATTRLKQLKPSRFNFIADADTTIDGFLAHEVSGIVPEAITGEKDAVDKDGNIEAQSIDQSKLVPLLTKALQEAIAKIETLEAKVTALESK